MSKVIRTFGSWIVLIGAICSVCYGQGCKWSGTEGWNSSLRDVIPDCGFVLLSPNGLLRLSVSPSGAMSLRRTSQPAKGKWRGPKLEPPAKISWSPNSDSFFVDDGDGSGLTSSFRLFRVKGFESSEDRSIEQAAVFLYRQLTHCDSSSADPNVWGFGWGEKGSKIFLLVQATVDEPCGRADEFMGLVVRTSDGMVLESLSKAQMKERFSSLLPPSMWSD